MTRCCSLFATHFRVLRHARRRRSPFRILGHFVPRMRACAVRSPFRGARSPAGAQPNQRSCRLALPRSRTKSAGTLIGFAVPIWPRPRPSTASLKAQVASAFDDFVAEIIALRAGLALSPAQPVYRHRGRLCGQTLTQTHCAVPFRSRSLITVTVAVVCAGGCPSPEGLAVGSSSA